MAGAPILTSRHMTPEHHVRRPYFFSRQPETPDAPCASRPRLAGSSVITSGPFVFPITIGWFGMVS